LKPREREDDMLALVVYESMFGNTEQVARAVAEGLGEALEVEMHEVVDAPRAIHELVDLIVVGGPTHAFSLSRPSTRTEALKQGGTGGSSEYGVREWLEGLPTGPHSENVATFDTRVERVRHLPGSAAKKATKIARAHGYVHAIARESFYVADVQGPLLPGELDRARAWGRELAAVVRDPFRGAGQVPSG
jgi:Flavodoxin